MPLWLVAAILIMFYEAFLVGQKMYTNYKFDRDLAALEKQVEAMDKKNQKLKIDIEYFKTEEYKEKVAREKLNKQKPGETVIVITPDNRPAEVAGVETKEKSNSEKWWLFLTNRLERN
ncbi:MAG: Septum formation initiator [candidate division CPR2 bacterium GW2011_GWC1_39_9]|uniref:Septum formation initiator n=1 Tax=candidate division CPR2 bacterium GW2011_GWC2_39_10 TaxID=1618345 RepID=A0A0G0LWJ9_UNCC2|nr:MAG: Septum formation initiator [candidate division CPR2 bacterium GW2011_GWC2_39_10]KKR36178.1 MAG: Septum formation initiator [candidate division CPR2 bacterium GW2011_GWC1_39_9]